MSVSLKLLNRFAFLNHVPPDAMKRLAARVTRLEAEPNVAVIHQGDQGDAFFLIVSGTVEILNAPDATQLNRLNAGQWFGDFALLDNQPRSATVRTVTRTTLLVLPKADFLWLVTTYPLVLHQLATSSQQQLRERDRQYLAAVETRAHQLEQLYSTALDITRHLDRDRALDAICQRAIKLLAGEGGQIYLRDAASNALMPQTANVPAEPVLRAGETCVGIAFSLGQVISKKSSRQLKRNEIAAPIQLTDEQGSVRQLGVLYVYRSGKHAAFTDSDCQLLELFASQAAIVIENADLIQMRVRQGQLENELQNARRVQQQLIPSKPPKLRGYQIASLWYPAKEVSGDYYDFIPFDDGRIGFVIADVSGKGLDSALFMANTRATLRAGAGRNDDAAAIISRANNALSNDSPAGMFVTAFLGIVEPTSGVCSYVNAGHNPPLVWRAQTQQLQLLTVGNRALAITFGYVYAAYAFTLEHGDVLLMYTDGVTEATDAQGALFGMERLEQAIRDWAGGTTQQLIQLIDTRVRAFTGAYPQSDDITVVALQRG